MNIRQNLKSNSYVDGRLIAIVGVWGLILFFLSGCAPSPPGISTPDPLPGVTEVTIQGYSFIPREVTIHAGEKVRWTNLEQFQVSHTTTSGDPSDLENSGRLWDSGLLQPGRPFTRQFNEVGEFTYFCRPHAFLPNMRGAKVIVVP